MMRYYWLAGAAVVIATGLTWIIKQLALRWHIVDRPELAPQRKQVHTTPIPLLGGTALYLTFVMMTAYLWPELTQGYLLPKHLVGLWIGGGIIMLGGWLDDQFGLKPYQQIIFPILSSIVVILSGIGVEYITNPLQHWVGGDIIYLNQWNITVFSWNGLPYQLTLIADLFTLAWLLGAMYTTKLLDGLDGLVPGVSAVGAFIIFLLSVSAYVQQPETGLLAIIFAGACLGFLIWNWSPAKIYLGEGGAVWCGFMLGVLAIISGSKLATALLILGLPIIDTAWVIIRRVLIEKRSPFSGDTLHLHFQLRALGWSDRFVALLFYAVTALFGFSTLLLSGTAKLAVLGVLLLVTTVSLIVLFVRVRDSSSKSEH